MGERPVNDDTPWVKVNKLTEDYSFGRIFRVLRAELQHRRLDGKLSTPMTRISFERGDSVAVLLYDRTADTVILVRQFRYPVYSSLSPDERGGEGARRAWTLEVVAGVKDAGATVTEIANKELLEEAGYRVKGNLEPMTSFYPSPGGSSERITLLFGEVDHHSRVGEGGGAECEGEDIEVVTIPFEDAMHMIRTGAIRDAKTIIALQTFALSK